MTSREKFEKWYVDEVSGCNGEWVAKLDNGQYYEISVTKAWLSWQACAAEKDNRIVELEAKLAIAIEALEKVGEVIDSLDGSYEKHTIRKQLQEALE